MREQETTEAGDTQLVFRVCKRGFSLYEKYNILKENDRFLEIGTGWFHFDSVLIRLFYDVKAEMFDVWDNRQFDALKQNAELFGELLCQSMDLTKHQEHRIRDLTKRISKSDSFSALYDSLGLNYVIDGNGTLESFEDLSLQLVCGRNVLEHVDRESASLLIKDIYRVLKPGGYSCHRIDLHDHLVSFSKSYSLHMKYYLHYSDKN